jgi:hypothetical protein
MDDARTMGFVEGRSDLNGVVESAIQWESAFADSRSQRFAVEQFHHEEVDVAFVSNIVQRADVGMVQRGYSASLSLEPFSKLGIGCEIGREDFDRDEAVEACVARAVHLSHAAGIQGVQDLVRTQSCSARQRHEGGVAEDYHG